MKIVMAALLAAASCIASAQTPPTTIVGSLPAAATPRDGFTRLRLSLASGDTSTSETPRLAGIALCTTSVCYESSAPSTVTISSTANGAGATIAELEVPNSDIVIVQFKSAAGQGILQGSVALPDPLKLEKGFQGGDVLVIVQKRGSGYVPVAAASNYVQSEGTTFFYNPKFATTVKLPHGVTLTIPAGATATPQVFLAGVHDTGDDYPLVDIFPAVKLAKAATVQFPVIARAASATLTGQAPATPRPQPAVPGGSLASPAQSARVGGSASVEINATGTVPRTPRATPAVGKQSSLPSADSNLAVDQAAACNQYGWCDCPNQLAYPANQQIIANALTPSGNEYLD